MRGQNNVQGGGDMGALPDKKVGGWRWDDPEAHTLFEDVWGTPLPKHEGLNQAEMMDAVSNGEIRCMYVIGENPVQSDADEHKHERLFGSLDFLVVQDILMTKTARMADVVLPAAASWAETDGTVINSERRVQRVRKAVEPPGEARDDIMIVRDIARRMGHDWSFETAEEVWDEVRRLAPKFSRHQLRAAGEVRRHPVAVPGRELRGDLRQHPQRAARGEHERRRERRGRGHHDRRDREEGARHHVPARGAVGRRGREPGSLHPR